MKTPFSDDTLPKIKAPKEPKPKMGSGDNYGIGFKAKVGKMRGDSVGYIPVSKNKMALPPRSVV